MNIKEFIKEISKTAHSDNFFNQFKDPLLCQNFEKYYEAVARQNSPRILMIGEAPGYLGCRKCGIPFASWNVLSSGKYDFMRTLDIGDQSRQSETEKSATIVWNCINDMPTVPLFWNAFPFHPHIPGNHNTNRAPTTQEVAKHGKKPLEALISVYRPDTIAAIGRVAEQTLRDLGYSEIRYIRHPSNGGSQAFKKGLTQLYSELSQKKA